MKQYMDVDDVTEVMGMYCKVCMEKDDPDGGFVNMEMILRSVQEEDCEHSAHTYEGRCPVCGTKHRYISYRAEVDYKFEKVEE